MIAGRGGIYPMMSLGREAMSAVPSVVGFDALKRQKEITAGRIGITVDILCALRSWAVA